MKRREKILSGIMDKPFGYMYPRVYEALKTGVPVLDVINAIVLGLKNKKSLPADTRSHSFWFLSEKNRRNQSCFRWNRKYGKQSTSTHESINRWTFQSRDTCCEVWYRFCKSSVRKKSMNFEGVIIHRYRTGKWDVRLVSPDEFRKVVEDDS